jgi:hypothetical protein
MANETDVSHLQLYCTIVLMATQLRSDARHVSKALQLSQALRYSEVADSPHNCLSAGLLVPMQD